MNGVSFAWIKEKRHRTQPALQWEGTSSFPQRTDLPDHGYGILVFPTWSLLLHQEAWKEMPAGSLE